MAMYPGTDIPFVLSKEAFDVDTLRSEGLSDEDIREKEQKLSPSKRRYVIDNFGQFQTLCATLIAEHQIVEFRNRDLFFVAGNFPHLHNAVTPLHNALKEFANGISIRLNGKADGFYSGPNTVQRSEVNALHERYPLSVFKLLRIHNTLRAATYFRETAVTDISNDAESTRDGLCAGAIVPSIWLVEPRYMFEVTRALDGKVQDQAIIHTMRSKYGANVPENLISGKLLADYDEERGVASKAFTVTKPFADALYECLSDLLADNESYTLPPFDFMFPSTEHSVKKITPLSKVDGNLINA